MMKRIVLDQSGVVRRMGTGIATYSANIAKAARAAGYGVDSLVSADVKIYRRNPLLSEVALFDANPKKTNVVQQLVGDVIGGLIGTVLGQRAPELPHAGVVIEPNPSAEKQPSGKAYVSTRLFEKAQAALYVHGRLATVRLPEAPDLFHATHPLPIRVAGCPNIVTIHDLVPLRLPYMTLDNKRYFYRLISQLVKTADHIVTVSEYSKSDIVSLFGVPEERVTNTYQAVTLPADVLQLTDDEIAESLRNLFELEMGEYYVFAGALEPKKNVARLIDAYAASGTKRPLLIVGGRGWQNEAEVARISDDRYAQWRIENNVISTFKRVRRIAYLPQAQLFTLMRGARALLFPSLFEGFGLPVLEAMTLGTPVLTSNVSSLPEIAGDAALLIDPNEVNSIAAGMRQLDADSDLRRELSHRGRIRAEAFNADAYTARIAALYGRLVGSSGPAM